MRLLYYTLVFLTVCQRLWELRHSQENTRALLVRGFVRREDASHLQAMVLMHVLWFVSLCLEPLVFERSVSYLLALPSAALFLGAQILRLWTLKALGSHWNISIMSPASAESKTGEAPYVCSGPYRFIRHPNYLAVIIELAALPLVGGAYITALTFSAANALLLSRRIRREEEYLFSRRGYCEAMREKGRFLPRFTAKPRARKRGEESA